MRKLIRLLHFLSPLATIAAIALLIINFQLEKDFKEVLRVIDFNIEIEKKNNEIQLVFNREMGKAIDQLELLYDQSTLSNNENFVNLMSGKHAVNLRPVRFSIRREIANKKAR